MTSYSYFQSWNDHEHFNVERKTAYIFEPSHVAFCIGQAVEIQTFMGTNGQDG